MDHCLGEVFVEDIVMVTMDYWYERTVTNCQTNV